MERASETPQNHLPSALSLEQPAAYVDAGRRSELVDSSLVLAEFGGDTTGGRAACLAQLIADLDGGLDIKNAIASQNILGSDSFLDWVKERFVGGTASGEQPATAGIRHYRRKEIILTLLAEQTGKNLENLRAEKGILRRLAMDLLYRHGGLRGPEIGSLFNVGYVTVSQERKRLRRDLEQDHRLAAMMRNLEGRLTA